MNAANTTDIIIPHFGCSPDITALCVRCLESIREHSADYRVILVDNGSPDTGYLPTLRTMPHMLIRNSTNLGFVKATNQGLTYSTAPYVVLMNNDTEAVPQWLPLLRTGFGDPSVGLSGPLTTSKNCWQGRYVSPTHEPVTLPNGHMLAFFCTMIRREVIDSIGVLDEDFGVGFGDDDEYCLRAERAGFRLALVRSLVIPHHHRTTFKQVYGVEAIPAMQEAALSLFYEKRREGR